MGKRKNELMLLSVVFMFLVIFIHVAAECVDGYVTSSVQFAVICSLHRLASFVVQGFIFLSGVKLFLGYREDFSYGKFYLARAKRVILPYLVCFALFYVYFIFTRAVDPSLGHFTSELITGGLVGHFYFVAIICQFYLLMPLWRLLYRRGSPIVWVVASFAIMILAKEYLPAAVRVIFRYEMKYNSRLFTYYLFYFVSGIFVGKYYEQVCGFVIKMKQWIYGISAFVGAVDCVFIYLIRRGIYYPRFAETWHVFYCVFAILTVFAAALSAKVKGFTRSRFLGLIDSASYNVYLIHPLFIFVSDWVSGRLGISSLTLRFVIKGLFTLVFAVGLCLVIEVIKGASSVKAKKVIYYLSPFILIPALFILLILIDGLIPVPSFFGIIVYILFAVLSFLIGRRSPSKHKVDILIAAVSALAMFAFMFVINFLDAGETYSRFDMRHAIGYATSASVLVEYGIMFISCVIGSILPFRKK